MPALISLKYAQNVHSMYKMHIMLMHWNSDSAIVTVDQAIQPSISKWVIS